MEGAENNETAANTKGHKPKEEFLSLFWTLSEQKDGSRLQATSKMVQLLAAKQKNVSISQRGHSSRGCYCYPVQCDCHGWSL